MFFDWVVGFGVVVEIAAAEHDFLIENYYVH